MSATEETVRESRHLPAFVRNGLERIEASPFVGDGRSVEWVRKLGETEFAAIEIRDEVNSKGKRARTTVKAEITERGSKICATWCGSGSGQKAICKWRNRGYRRSNLRR